MEILQVKEYHNKIAKPRELRALRKFMWGENGYGYPIKSMYYYMLEDRYGQPTKIRKNGYVAFELNDSAFGKTKELAVLKFIS